MADDDSQFLAELLVLLTETLGFVPGICTSTPSCLSRQAEWAARSECEDVLTIL